MADTHEMGNYPRVRDVKATTSQTHEVVAVTLDRDTLALARAGKKQVLKRRFGLLSLIGIGSSVVITWEGMIATMGIALTNGGPAGLLYGAIITWLGTLSTFIAIGELSSMLPTAGGQYHWASILAPASSKKLLSYIAGWVTVAAWIATPTAASFFAATMTQELIALNVPSYSPQGWQAMLLMWGYLALAVLINTVLGALLPVIELLFLTLHIVGFFAVLIPLVNLAPHGNAHDVFTLFNNGGNWNTMTLSFFVGLQGNAAAMLGTDGSVHMSEEAQKSDTNVAWSMVSSLAVNGAMGFAMLIAFLFCAGPLDQLLQSESSYPFIDILSSGTGNLGATTVLVSVVIVMNFCAAVSGVSSGSRMLWAFARDQGLPFYSYLRQVGKRNSIPIVAILVVVVCCGLLGIIQVGSSTALSAILSLVLAGYYASYLCVLMPLLYHRVKGNIVEPRDGTEYITQGAEDAAHVYVWGPWRLKGIWGIANNAIAVVFLIIVFFFGLWPNEKDPSAGTMNWGSAVFGGIAILSILYYVVAGRRTYDGPIVEVEAQKA